MYRATSDTFEPAANVSLMILIFSIADQWHRRSPLAKISTFIDPMPSSLDQGHMLRRSPPTNKALLIEDIPFRYDDRP
jgi:hypothetical protein